MKLVRIFLFDERFINAGRFEVVKKKGDMSVALQRCCCDSKVDDGNLDRNSNNNTMFSQQTPPGEPKTFSYFCSFLLKSSERVAE